MRIFQVNAYWDEDTCRWTATSDEISGLVCETGSYKELREVLRDVVPELLRFNLNYHGEFGININSHNSMLFEMAIAAE